MNMLKIQLLRGRRCERDETNILFLEENTLFAKIKHVSVEKTIDTRKKKRNQT